MPGKVSLRWSHIVDWGTNVGLIRADPAWNLNSDFRHIWPQQNPLRRQFFRSLAAAEPANEAFDQQWGALVWIQTESGPRNTHYSRFPATELDAGNWCFVRFAEKSIFTEPNFRSARMEFGLCLNGIEHTALNSIFPFKFQANLTLN